ncbi:MAG: hypothetical protein ACK55I_37150, partial [bacterium]
LGIRGNEIERTGKGSHTSKEFVRPEMQVFDRRTIPVVVDQRTQSFCLVELVFIQTKRGRSRTGTDSKIVAKGTDDSPGRMGALQVAVHQKARADFRRRVDQRMQAGMLQG